VQFKKTQTQCNAIDKIVTSSASNVCFYGGSRSGKSFLIMRILLIRASKAKSDHLIVRETFSSAKASIWQKTLPDVLRMCFPNLSVKYNNTDYVCTLPNGSTIKIAGLDDQKKIERLLGTEYSSLWYNESNQIAYPAVNKLKTRLAQKNSLRKMSYFDLNPTKTSSWVYQVFEEGVNPQDGEMLPDPENYLSVQMNVQGNLENIDDEYLAILNAMPELERKRFLDGEYDTTNLGKAVYAFDKLEHVSEDAKRQSGTIYVGSDFNIDWNSDVLASRTNDYLYIWDEIQIAGDTFKKADALKRKGATGASVVADSTGKARRTSGKSDHIILKEAGFRIIPTVNPLVVDKIANLNRCLTLGLIRIHPRCKKLIRDLLQLKWDKHGQLDQKTDPSLSHLVDCLAYLCWHVYPLVGSKEYRAILS
jgi:hypothetical protein